MKKFSKKYNQSKVNYGNVSHISYNDSSNHETEDERALGDLDQSFKQQNDVKYKDILD